MRLTALLTQPGGIAEQGMDVEIRLRYLGPGGIPHVRDVAAVMHPIAEGDLQRCATLARAARAPTVDPDGKPVPPLSGLGQGPEELIQLLRISLRDPSDLSRLLIEDERDMAVLRSGLVGPQYDTLWAKYRQLIRQEYPDIVTDKDVKDLENEARLFTKSDQPVRG